MTYQIIWPLLTQERACMWLLTENECSLVILESPVGLEPVAEVLLCPLHTGRVIQVTSQRQDLCPEPSLWHSAAVTPGLLVNDGTEKTQDVRLYESVQKQHLTSTWCHNGIKNTYKHFKPWLAFLPPDCVLNQPRPFSQSDGKTLPDIPLLGGEALCVFPVADNRLSLKLYWAADDLPYREKEMQRADYCMLFHFHKSHQKLHTRICLRDQLKGVVYQVSPVFVAQSSVVFPQQFSHQFPPTILIMNHIIACHVRVYLHPAGFLSYVNAIWIKHIEQKMG